MEEETTHANIEKQVRLADVLTWSDACWSLLVASRPEVREAGEREGRGVGGAGGAEGAGEP